MSISLANRRSLSAARRRRPVATWHVVGGRKRQAETAGVARMAVDGDRNAELSNANKSFADHRVTGDPPCSSPRRRATSTQILESTNNHKPYFTKRRTGFCLLGFISDVRTTSLAEERANSRAGKRKCGKAGSPSKESRAGRNSWPLIRDAPVSGETLPCRARRSCVCLRLTRRKGVRAPGALRGSCGADAAACDSEVAVACVSRCGGVCLAPLPPSLS
jgi:hypothetical protein